MAETFSFSVTGYAGYEAEILDFRNLTRVRPQNRTYLDWRYTGEKSPQPPRVFWLRDAQGHAAAMASTTFRSYYVGGRPCRFAVLGDLCVQPEHQGKGLMTTLLQNIQTHTPRPDFDCAYVMPVPEAERALAKAGWRRTGELVPLVFMLNPEKKLKRVLKSDGLARAASVPMRSLTRLLAATRTRGHVSMRTVTDFDADFQTFWQSLPKSGLILRDRSLEVLHWRYQSQPGIEYIIRKFCDRETFAGYLVASKDSTDDICLVLDFVVSRPELVAPCMARFLEEAARRPDIETVRIIPNDHCQYVPRLKRLGFVPRKEIESFYTCLPQDKLLDNPAAWFIMFGDKDAL